MQRSLKYRGDKIWNEIPAEVRISGYATFKKALSNFYQQNKHDLIMMLFHGQRNKF